MKPLKQQQKCYAPIDHQYNHFQYVFPIITWRKANAIHKFFVDTCQEGNDNCQRHYVSKENLAELLETINTILAVKTPVARRTKAEELLPTEMGCFFGSEDYDDWYFQNLKRTKTILEKVFEYEENAEAGKCFDSFYYQSSWQEVYMSHPVNDEILENLYEEVKEEFPKALEPFVIAEVYKRFEEMST